MLDKLFNYLFIGDPNNPRDHGLLDEWLRDKRGLYWVLFAAGMAVCWWLVNRH